MIATGRGGPTGADRSVDARSRYVAAMAPATSLDWSFARRPFWLFSHVFVAACIAGMVWAAMWQWGRHQERLDLNEVVEARVGADPVPLAQALAGIGWGVTSTLKAGEMVEFTPVTASITWLDDEFVRIANRSQNGEAGDWLVGLAETDEGTLLLVNRGFIRRELDADPVAGTELAGWLRATRIQEGLGAADTGEGRAPRLDVDAIAGRVAEAGFDATTLAPVWLQLETPTGEGYPLPVPLPPPDDGPHFSYTVQWVIFATLTTVFYLATLRYQARERPQRDDLFVDDVI